MHQRRLPTHHEHLSRPADQTATGSILPSEPGSILASVEEFADRPPREPADEIPEDIQAQVLGPLMQRHIESWIDEPIPALKGKTPREAVKTKAGRAKVVSMLKDQENSMERQPGHDLVDFGVVYEELGLSR